MPPTATLVCALALGLVGSADASSGPRDFEMRGPAAGAATASRSGAFRSPVLRAPGRFDLVGLHWTSRLRPTIALRARKAGGHWTKWTHVTTDPEDSPD